MKVITREEVEFLFPDVRFYFDGKYQFNVKNITEIYNIRIWALSKKVTARIKFLTYTTEKGERVIIETTLDPDSNMRYPACWDLESKKMAQIIKLVRERAKVEF